jgi:hypothetical protein
VRANKNINTRIVYLEVLRNLKLKCFSKDFETLRLLRQEAAAAAAQTIPSICCAPLISFGADNTL